MLYLAYHWETDQDPIQISLLCYGVTVVFGYLWTGTDLTFPPLKALQLSGIPDNVSDFLRDFGSTQFYHDAFDSLKVELLALVSQPCTTFIPHELWEPLEAEFEKKIFLATPESTPPPELVNNEKVLHKAETIESKLSQLYHFIKSPKIEEKKVKKRGGYYHSKSSEAWSMMNHFYLGKKG
jgi:hypothetical protein